MRIIAGERKGLHLKSLKGLDTRPTSDMVKESLFNRIGPYFDGGIVVELFGGSGALSLEALSRGADEAFVFEKNRKACDVIRSNAEKCHYDEVVHIQPVDAQQALKVMQKHAKNIDLLFLDPPYAEAKFYDLAQKFVDDGRLTDRAVIVCEHDKKTKLPEAYGLFQKSNCTSYGNVAISIYEKWGFTNV